jgi:hypothetical protein
VQEAFQVHKREGKQILVNISNTYFTDHYWVQGKSENNNLLSNCGIVLSPDPQIRTTYAQSQRFSMRKIYCLVLISISIGASTWSNGGRKCSIYPNL